MARVKLFTWCALGILVIVGSVGCSQHNQVTEMSRTQPITNVLLGLRLEWAKTIEEQTNGLKNRQSMPENEGMMFAFADSTQGCFWMSDTLIHLSVGFIDENGVLFQIEDMQPRTSDMHCPKRPMRYALEVNQGWFDRLE